MGAPRAWAEISRCGTKPRLGRPGDPSLKGYSPNSDLEWAMNDDDVSLGRLRALSLLLEVGSLTQAAQILGMSQPSVSKALARLRAHFGDPLLVRVGAVMRPTPKALALTEPLRALLNASETLRASGQTFDPAVSVREFSCLVTEVGMVQVIPALMQRLEQAGPGLSLRAVPLDAGPFEPRLEAGEADLAGGYFP